MTSALRRSGPSAAGGPAGGFGSILLAQALRAGLGGADPMAAATLHHGEAVLAADAEWLGPGRRIGGAAFPQRRQVAALLHAPLRPPRQPPPVRGMHLTAAQPFSRP